MMTIRMRWWRDDDEMMTAASDRQCPPVARQLSGRRQISLGGGLPSHRLRYISGPTFFNLYFSIFPNIFMFSLKFLPLNIIIIPSLGNFMENTWNNLETTFVQFWYKLWQIWISLGSILDSFETTFRLLAGTLRHIWDNFESTLRQIWRKNG